MFADGPRCSYDRTRRLILQLAVPLKATPLRVSIVGHTRQDSAARSDYGGFDPSADRANVVPDLEREGLLLSHIFAVSGRADSQPFPDDPTLPANRRVITLMRENPPLPPNLSRSAQLP
jgi:chemotaxis protein MotB